MVDEGDKVYSESFHLVVNRTLDDKAPDSIVGFEVSQHRRNRASPGFWIAIIDCLSMCSTFNHPYNSARWQASIQIFAASVFLSQILTPRRLIAGDIAGKAVQLCERQVLIPYYTVLKSLGWFGLNKVWCFSQQRLVIALYLLAIGATFVTQGLLCFQRDLLLLLEEQCVDNSTIDANFICCKNHFISAFVVPDFLLISSYLFGIYLFSSSETEYISNLAAKVFIKAASIGGERGPRRLVNTIRFYFIAGVVWILISLVVRILYLNAYAIARPSVKVYWNDAFMIADSTKIGLIVWAVIGFVLFDVMYMASLINYAIQSELNIHLLHGISRWITDKVYAELADQPIKDINDAVKCLKVLNGKTATGVSLVLLNLSISAVISFQQLQDLESPNRLGVEKKRDDALGYTVACLNAFLWTVFIILAILQAARVTREGGRLKNNATAIRARPFQYANTPRADLDSLIQYTQAAHLRAKLFGIPIQPWMFYLTLLVFPLIILILVRTNMYSLFPRF